MTSRTGVQRYAFLLVFSMLVLSMSQHIVTASTTPAGIITTVPITITNTQGVATASPFQQKLELNVSNYTAYLNTGTLQNVEFSYSNGTLVPSWLESYSNGTAIYWLKLSRGLSADSSTTIYLDIANQSTNLFNAAATGEAPQLSPTYAEYDNGANIFTNYWNFNGDSLSGFQTGGSPGCCGYGGVSADNGLTLSSYAPLQTSSTYLQTDSAIRFPAAIDIDLAAFSVSSSFSAGGSYDLFIGNYIYGDYIGTTTEVLTLNNGAQLTFSAGNTVTSNSTYAGMGGEYTLTGTPSLEWDYPAGALYNYTYNWNNNHAIGTVYWNGTGVSLTNYTIGLSESAFVQCPYCIGYSSGVSEDVQWLRVRAVPPNGVMPSVTTGQPENGTSLYNVTFKETGLPTGITWNVILNGTVVLNGTGNGSAGNTIAFHIANGTYPFSMGSADAALTSSPTASGLLVVKGNTNVSIEWVEATENNRLLVLGYGLPQGQCLSLSIGPIIIGVNGSLGVCVSGETLAAPLSGYYTVKVYGINGYVPYPKEFNVTNNLFELDTPQVTSQSYATELIAFLPDSGSTYGLNAMPPFNPILNVYGSANYGSIWEPRGDCYGIASTELLYYQHYQKNSLASPVFPSQVPIEASDTSQLSFGTNPYSTLNNITFAILVHQMYDPKNQNNPLAILSVNLNENAQIASLINSLNNGQPAELTMWSSTYLIPSASDVHDVSAFAVGTYPNGTEKIAIADSVYPGSITFASYNSNSGQFSYDGDGNTGSLNNFLVVNPQVADISWFSSPWLNVGSIPSNWIGTLENYELIASDVPIAVCQTSFGCDHFNSPYNSQTFVDYVTGSSGIAEGTIGNGGVELYAIPSIGRSAPTILDPSNSSSQITIIKYGNVSGQSLEYGYRINAASTSSATLNYTVVPKNSGLVLTTENTPVSINMTFFNASSSISTFNVTGLLLKKSTIATFNVTTWHGMNSANYSIVLRLANSSTPNAITEYYLFRNQSKKLIGCLSNSGNVIGVSGSSKHQSIQITNQSGVAISGSSDNVIINMPGLGCAISITTSGSSEALSVYNGSASLTVSGSSDVVALKNTTITNEKITGSSDKVIGGTIKSNTLTMQGSSQLQIASVLHLNTMTISGSTDNAVLNALTNSLTSITVSGSSDVMHINNATIALTVSGSSDSIYVHNTIITGQTLKGSNDKVYTN